MKLLIAVLVLGVLLAGATWASSGQQTVPGRLLDGSGGEPSLRALTE